MILLIDNFDSFTYNVFQLVGQINPDVRVVRNNAITPEEIEALAPTISPASSAALPPATSLTGLSLLRSYPDQLLPRLRTPLPPC